MSKRNDEIRAFLDGYKPLLEFLEIDAAHAERTDRWYLFRIGHDFGDYEYFVEVDSASEMINSLLSELSYDMHVEIGYDDIDTPECEKTLVADRVEKYLGHDCLPELTAILEYMKENNFGKANNFIDTLEALLSDKK